MRIRTGALMVCALAGQASASFVTFSGPLGTTRPAFEAAAGGSVPRETFESFANGAIVGDMPNVQAFFSPEYADGSPAPLPVVLNNSPVTSPRWIGNFGNGRPFWSSWVIRPDAGESIYAFGQVNSQGDWVRILAYDASNTLIGQVDASPISHCFAGFVSTTPIAKVVVTPLGNADGANGMDDVSVSIVPAPGAAVGLLGLALLSRRRR
ncbi:hypothetical protein PHYC_01731 [Phycisphaerales bacterium]|nr:hypothetical protein PHYC_01731 [Phycisphaerales bacterium]